MNTATVALEDIELLVRVWHDHFEGGVAKPSWFAVWLRMYPIDIIADSFAATRRAVEKAKAAGGKKFETWNDAIKYMSAVMRNKKAEREVDAQWH
jgi:hypothetical protein